MAVQAFDEQLLAALRRHILEPLARSCEADLRLHLVRASPPPPPPHVPPLILPSGSVKASS